MSLKIYNSNDETYVTLSTFVDDDDRDTNLENGYCQLVMYYVIADIFTAVQKRTALRGKYPIQDQGPGLDRVAMTADEETIFDEILPGVSSDIWKKVSAYGKGIDNAYVYDDTIDSVDNVIGFYLLMDEYWDLNVLTNVDQYIKDAFTHHVCQRWYNLIGLKEYEMDEMVNYRNEMSRGRMALWNRTKNHTRPGRIF